MADSKEEPDEAEESEEVDAVDEESEAVEEKAEEAVDEIAEETANYPAFKQSDKADSVTVTVAADEGTFPEGARLVVSSATNSEEKKADKLVEEVRDTDRNVAASYTLDISVVDKDGNELQPANGNTAQVAFKTDEMKEDLLTPEVYHIHEHGSEAHAEALDTTEKKDTVVAETDGFSVYKLIFEQLMVPDYEIASESTTVDQIMSALNLHGDIYSVVIDDNDMSSDEIGKGVHRSSSEDERFTIEYIGDKENVANKTDSAAKTKGSEWEITKKAGGNSGTSRIVLTLSGRPTYYIDIVSNDKDPDHKIILRHMDGKPVVGGQIRNSEIIEIYVTGYTAEQQSALRYLVKSQDIDNNNGRWLSFNGLKDTVKSTTKEGNVVFDRTGNYTGTAAYVGGKYLAFAESNGNDIGRVKSITLNITVSTVEKTTVGTLTQALTIGESDLGKDLKDVERKLKPVVLYIGGTGIDLRDKLNEGGIAHLSGCTAEPSLTSKESSNLVNLNNNVVVANDAAGHETITYTLSNNECMYHYGKSGDVSFDIYVLNKFDATLDKDKLTISNINPWCYYVVEEYDSDGNLKGSQEIYPKLKDENANDEDKELSEDTITVEALKLGFTYKVKEVNNINFAEAQGTATYLQAGAADASFTVREVSHVHEWEYAASTNTLTATCKNTDNGHTGANPIAIELTTNNVDYSGAAYTGAAVTNTDDFSAETGATIGAIEYYNGTTKLGAAPTDVGTYKAKVTVSYTENGEDKTAILEKEFNISRANSTKTDPTAVSGLTYDGSAQELISGGSAEGGTMKYRLGETGEWTSEVPTATQAGDYEVYYYVEGDGNHNDIGSKTEPSGSVTVSIASLSIADNDVKLIIQVANAGAYTGEAKKPAVTVTYDGTTLTQGTDFDVVYENNTDAGTATAKITLKGNYRNQSGNPITKAFDIEKADLNVTVSQGDITYGDEVEPTVIGTPSSGTETKFEYKVAGADDSTYTETKPTDAGNYVVRATVTGDNYKTATATGTFKISPKSISAGNIDVTLANTTEEYDGSVKTVTATVKVGGKELVVGEDYDLTVNPDPVKNAGDYTVTIKLKGNYNGETSTIYTITKATAAVTIEPTAISNLTYNGKDQTLINAAAVKGGTVEYALSANGPWAEEIPSGKAAGTYNVYYKVVGDDNHVNSAVSGPVEVKIAPKEITVTADAKSSGYKENLEKLTYSIPEGALVNGDKSEDLKITASTSATNTSPAGEYDITLSQGEDANENYNVELVKGKYTITKLKATVTVKNGDAEYDGKDHSINVSVQGNTLGELIGKLFGHDPERAEATVYYSDSTELTEDNYKEKGSTDNPTFKDAGEHTVYYYIELANHDAEPAGSIKGSSTVNISKKELTITATNKTITYGDAPSNDGVTYAGFVTGENKSKLSGTLAYNYNYEQFGKVGKYSITPSGRSSSNYEIRYVEGVLTVDPKSLSFEWPEEDESSFVYDGTEKSVKAKPDGLVNNDAITLTYQDNKKTGKGDYTAKVKGLNGDKAGNYIMMSGSKPH